MNERKKKMWKRTEAKTEKEIVIVIETENATNGKKNINC
jgi:hypothetical protein